MFGLDMNLLVLICVGAMLFLMLIILIVLIARKPKQTDNAELEEALREEMDSNRKEVADMIEASRSSTVQEVTGMINMLGTNNNKAVEQLGNYIGQNQGLAAEMQAKQLQNITDGQNAFVTNVNGQLDTMRKALGDQLDSMGKRMTALESANREGMREMREENARKLEEIRGTVDEKLQSTLEKRIAESFNAVNDRLEQVYKGIGEMQAIASDVGGLKKVLSGVKTRGILGEIQLGAILEEILSPEQYDTNVALAPGKTERVEFAVKLPGADGTVYLPIDSKFPGDRYQQLLDAQDTADKTVIETAYKNLETVIRSEARDIKEKYICVPYTTNFAIMFLPFEGLYAEVVNRGMVETLQRDFQVNVAGPSTMAALLNSLQMGFRTLAIQKRSGEVWKILSEVKSEFETFEEALGRMQKHLSQTTNDLDTLIGTRSRAINRKLRDVEVLDSDTTDTTQIFGLSDGNY